MNGELSFWGELFFGVIFPLTCGGIMLFAIAWPLDWWPLGDKKFWRKKS